MMLPCSMSSPYGFAPQYKHVILVASFLAQTIEFGIVWTVGLFNIFFLEAFDGDTGATALICSLNTSFFYAAGPVSGACVNRFGYRVTCVCGGLVATLGLVLSSVAPNMYVLYATFGVLTGLGLGISYVPSLSIIAVHYRTHQTLAFAVATSGVGLGVVVFPFIIHLLSDTYGWRGATLLTAGISLQLCLLGALLRQPADPPHKTTSSGNNITGDDQQKQPSDTKRSCDSLFNVTIFQDLAFVAFCVHNTLYWFGHSVVSIHLPTYAQSLGLSSHQAGVLLSVTGITGFVGKFPVGLLSLYRHASPIRVYTVGVVLCCSVVATIPVATQFLGLVTYSAMFGFLLAIICGMLPSVVVDILDVTLLPSGYGYILMFEAVGSLLGAPLAGYVYDSVERYDVSFYLAGCAMLLSSVFLIFPLIKIHRTLVKNQLADQVLSEKLVQQQNAPTVQPEAA